MERQSNYDLSCERFRSQFLAADKGEIVKRIPFIQEKEETFWLTHFARTYGISLRDGVVRAKDLMPVSKVAEMNIYTLLYYATPGARQTGRFVDFGSLRNGAPFAPAFRKGVVEPLAATFSGREDTLREAVTRLCGTALLKNGFCLWAFDCMPVHVYFWDGDEEFPAQANMLFDESAVDFIHIESVVTIGMECLERLAKTASLPIKGSPLHYVW